MTVNLKEATLFVHHLFGLKSGIKTKKQAATSFIKASSKKAGFASMLFAISVD
jgi:hypothetical protein